MRQLSGDRIGLGWRPELAGSIMAHLDEIDALEVIAESWIDAPAHELRGLKSLARTVPLAVHGVSLGLASTHAVDRRRLDRMARLVGAVEPEIWSEHLAFVRAGGLEIGHMAMPPLCADTIEGTLDNLDRAVRVVGAAPAMENIASLVVPPCSTLHEGDWTGAICSAVALPLLLDLHNLYANAVNSGSDPFAYLARFPLEQVRWIHLSGGRWIDEPGSNGARRRLLDDHLHDVPDPVFVLLTEVARRAPSKLTVIIERDGNYPAFDRILAELRWARTAVAAGRRAALEALQAAA
jgi:uncharacterized protein (UPF0276 family)